MTKVTQISFDDSDGPGHRRIHLREISGDSDAPLETVGQDIRAARLRRGEDLATVSRALKIRKEHLEAVEEGNYAGLPGKTYAIGYVRSYAGYLGLDIVQTVERYKQEIAGRHEDQPPVMSHVVHSDDLRRLPHGWRIVAGIVCLALIYGVWHLVSAGPAPQPVPPAPSLNPAPVRSQAAKAAVPVPAAPLASPADAAPTGQTATPPPAAASVPSSPSAAQAAPSAAANPTSGGAVPSPAVPAVPPASQASGQTYGRLNANARVVLRARGDTHIEVRGQDGMVYINRELKPGDSYQLPNLVGLSLSTSNAGAVEIDLDGLAMGRAGGAAGTVGDVSLDPQDIVDRFNGHPG